METNNTEINNLSSDIHPFTLSSSFVRGETSAPTTHQNPRKKRTKFTRTDTTIHGGISKPKPKTARRPDPAAPKITRPCTECGKKFWSWKALFGHMRCHPERQWRGINPPPNFRRRLQDTITAEEDSSSVTEEDQEVATCLLMLSSGPSDQSPSVTTEYYCDSIADHQIIIDHHGVGTSTGNFMSSCGGFECSSCKKVFGSHQALGGHRASHKNVKGCYAITKNDIGEEEEEEEEEEEGGWCLGLDMMMMKDSNSNSNSNINGHKCSICFRVFSSGQALGGHMRCHWEKDMQPSTRVSAAFDLNLAVQDDHDDDASSFPSLDLRLGL